MASRSRSKAAARGTTSRGARAPPPARARASELAAEPAEQATRDLSRTWLRVFAEHQHASAALLFALLVLAYLWPVLLGGKALSPIAMLYGQIPWAVHQPRDLANYLNPLLSDVAVGHYPWNFYARQLIHDGTFPAWNPHIFAGVPFFANPQTVLASPFSLPIWALPLNYGIGVSAALKLWAAAFGTYLLVRELKLGFLPGLLAGVAFGLCSYNVMWLTHESVPGVSVMLPWTLWLVERLLRRGGLGTAIGLAVATAVAVTGGHPGTQVHLLAATGLYAVLRVVTLGDLERGDRLRRLALAGGAVALGVLLVAVIFVPEVRSSHGTLGTQARLGGVGTEPGTQMPFTTIRTTLFPDWWGRPSSFEAANVPTGPVVENVTFETNFNERTFYAGVVASLLACVALVSGGQWRRKAPFAVLGVLALAIPLDAPGLHWLVEHLPAFDVIQNQRMHFVFELAVAVLAAFGLHAVLERPRGERRRFAVVGAAIALGVGLAARSGASGADLRHVVDHFTSGRDFGEAGHVLALTSVAWFLLFALGLGVAVLAARRWPRRTTAIAAGLVLLAAGDMLHFVHGYQPMAPASVVPPPRTPAIAYLQRHAREGRFVGLENAVVNDTALLYGLSDVRGYDPPQPTLRFFRLWFAVNPGQREWQSLSMPGISTGGLQVASVLGARYVVTNPGAKLPPSRNPAFSALRPVYAGKDATVFVNERAVPRAMVAPAVQVTADEAATRARITQRSFDPRREVVVERDQPGVAAVGDGGAPVHGTATVARETNSSVTLSAMLSRRGLVVLNDDFTDGWSVTVDGRAAPAVHVNDVMRGVIVGPGRHTVVWRYRVPGLAAGAILSLVSLVALLGAGVALVVRRRRGDAAAPSGLEATA
jgi:hypothetical protein